MFTTTKTPSTTFLLFTL